MILRRKFPHQIRPVTGAHVAGSHHIKQPDILYVKLKSLAAFDKVAGKQRYNKPGVLKSLFSRGDFFFDPQISTAKLDRGFAEHPEPDGTGRFHSQ